MVESVQLMGLSILLFRVLPRLDVIRALFLTSGLFCLPSLFKLFFARTPNLQEVQSGNQSIHKQRLFQMGWWVLNALACVAQLSVFVVVAIGGFEFMTPAILENARMILPECEMEMKNNMTDPSRACRQAAEPFLFSNMWEPVVALLFTSFYWWENYVDQNLKVKNYVDQNLKVKNYEDQNSKVKNYGVKNLKVKNYGDQNLKVKNYGDQNLKVSTS